MRQRTLASRLFVLTAIWAVIATALVAWFLSQGFRATAQENLTQRLQANLYNIMGTVSPGDDGKLEGQPDLRDSRFQAFRSGYYWSVANVSNPQDRLASRSLVGQELPIEDTGKFDSDFQRSFRSMDEFGNRLIGIEAQAFLGEGDTLYTFRISGNLSEVDAQVSVFINRLLVVLALFALGFMLVTYFLLRFGLAPLILARERLADIREGRAEKLEGDFPLEIQPLIDETNSLIASNRTVVERARTQVGNLAHSLKTPLAVLRNEASRARPEVRNILDIQVNQMEAQIQTYLDRARISARAGTITSRTDIRPVLERLVRVLGKLNPYLSVEAQFAEEGPCWFAGEQQDFEEMTGNLMENACKFAVARVVVSVLIDQPHLFVTISDDGKGMNEEEIGKALQRGTRLDESKPGSGLGLSIVKDTAGEYGGTLTIGKSDLGGLATHLTLPTIREREN